ncbi:MAG: hypothetical protein M3256_18165 [Actinomycetota bacterium]|nr:hypothetical protein [Actinomycetota bacterium]
MPSLLIVGLIVAGVLATLGILVIISDILSMWLELRFTENYWQHFARFTTAGSGSYEWLLRRSTKMQVLLGPRGITDYKPAGSTTFLRGYAVLVNTLPGILEGSEDPDIVRRCGEIIVRHAGWLQDSLRGHLLQLLNPAQWLLRGLDVPARILVALRIVKPSQGESPILRVLTLLGLVVGILANWNGATAVLRSHGVIP